MIQRDLVQLAAPRRQAEHAPHDLLVDPEFMRHVAHPRRAEAVRVTQQRLRARPNTLLLRRHAHFVLRPAQPGTIQHHGTVRHQALHRRREQRRGQARMEGEPQLLLSHALQVGPLGVIGVERRSGSIAEALPGSAPHGDGLMPTRQRDEIITFDRPVRGISRGGTVAEERIQIHEAARSIQQRPTALLPDRRHPTPAAPRGAPACGACAPARAGRSARRRRWCGWRTCRG